MLKKFKRQKKSWDCSIIALINSLIFLGKEFSFKPQYNLFLALLSPETNKKKKPGVTVTTFSNFVQCYFKKVKVKKSPTLKYLYSNSKKKKLIIIGAQCGGINHVAIIDKMTSKHIYLVNWGKNYPVVRKMSIEDFEIISEEFSICWVVDKE